MTENEVKKRLNFKNLDIDDHAVKRAIQRFKRKDKADALGYCKSLLGHSRYVGETTCDRGNRAHMFIAPNKVEIYLTLDLLQVKTLMDNKDKKYIVYDKSEKSSESYDELECVFSEVKQIPLQDKLIKLYQIEFKKHDRLEKKMNKEFTEYRLQKNIEIAQLHLEAYNSKSNKIKEIILIKIKGIEDILSSNLLELKKIQDDKRKIAKVLSSLLTS